MRRRGAKIGESQWCRGSTRVSGTLDPGSTPGWDDFYLPWLIWSQMKAIKDNRGLTIPSFAVRPKFMKKQLLSHADVASFLIVIRKLLKNRSSFYSKSSNLLSTGDFYFVVGSKRVFFILLGPLLLKFQKGWFEFDKVHHKNSMQRRLYWVITQIKSKWLVSTAGWFSNYFF